MPLRRLLAYFTTFRGLLGRQAHRQTKGRGGSSTVAPMTSANLFRRLAAGEVSEAEVAVALDVSPTEVRTLARVFNVAG